MRGGEGEHEAQHVASKHDVFVVVVFCTRVHGNAMLDFEIGSLVRRLTITVQMFPNSKLRTPRLQSFISRIAGTPRRGRIILMKPT